MTVSKGAAGLLSFSLHRMLPTLIILLSAFCLYAQSPGSLPNPNVGDPGNFIADPYDLVSRNTENHINSELEDLRKTTTCEVAVAVVKSTAPLSIEDYSYELFRHWGLGKKDKNNGVLLVIAVDDRKARIEVGSGAEGAFPDITAGKIIRKAIIPAMKDGNLNQAASGAIDMVVATLSEPEVAAELRSEDAGSEPPVTWSVILRFLLGIVCAIFVLMLGMFLLDLAAVRKRDNYRRAMIWHTHMRTYWWGALFSCGLALPIALIAWRLYRRSREVTEICDSCGAKMKKLSEDEDNAFLTASQDFEERLGTVDYDVWLCPECGTVERFPFVEHQLKYHKCPECNTIAMSLVMDKVVDAPTTTRPGHGERVYQCQFCRHSRREGYVIPKKPDPAAAALAAGVAAGATRGRSSGGGGFSGGGFGGGHSSGGGASGGW